MRDDGQMMLEIRILLNISYSSSVSLHTGFIFINCTAPNETRITQWVFAASNTLCVEPTSDTTVGKKTAVTVSLKPSISITSSNQTVTSSSRDEPWFISK